MEATKCHAPVFCGTKHNNTTVSAYCPNCDTILKEYRQQKCSKCGFDIYWLKNNRR